jgi:hypothetical protein
MGAEAVVVGRVANGRGQWAAQGEVVVDEQAPPWGHDHADCFGERLGFAERTLEIAEEVSERDIDRFGHELRLAAREEAAERAAGPPEWATTSRSPVPWMPRSRMSVAALRTMRARAEIAGDRRPGPSFRSSQPWRQGRAF